MFWTWLFLTSGLLTPCSMYSQDDIKPKDFSNTNTVSLLLAAAERADGRQGDGLEHAYWQADGRTTLMNVQGVPCRCLHLTAERFPKGYLYFTMDPTFKTEEVEKVKIEVEYFDGFDGQAGVLGLQYDATLSENRGPNPAFKPCYPNVPLRGSQKWLKATFHVNDGSFQNSQSGQADFRLWASPPEVCVKRVTVTLQPAHQWPQASNVLAFNAAGEARLGEWNVQWDASSKPSFASNRNSQKGPRWLEVRAPGTFGAGSWRTTPLLAPGEYQFVGKVRIEGLDAALSDEPSGVSLRMSYGSSGRIVSEAPDWTMLTYNFAMPALGYAELICEFRGGSGSARFDLDSLKLIRRTP